VVGPSVCLLVTFVSPAKTAEPIEMPLGEGRLSLVGQRNHVLDGVQIPMGKRQCSVVVSIEKYREILLRCTKKTTEPIEVPFEGLTHVGQRNHYITEVEVGRIHSPPQG